MRFIIDFEMDVDEKIDSTKELIDFYEEFIWSRLDISALWNAKMNFITTDDEVYDLYRKEKQEGRSTATGDIKFASGYEFSKKFNESKKHRLIKNLVFLYDWAINVKGNFPYDTEFEEKLTEIEECLPIFRSTEFMVWAGKDENNENN